ncbi:MAG TPA: hypothetical protein VMY38_04195 [Gemmatimonadaceae bacterium]|nr:hypothetical protein [Gemmatimonadaceae bacterium]
MRFKQVAIVVVAMGFVGCKPAAREAGTPSAASADSATGQVQVATASSSGCRTAARDAEGGLGKTPVQICAVPGTHETSSDNAPLYGFVVATLQNRGTTVRDARWKLEPGKMYYLRVFKARTGQTEDGYYEISSLTGANWDPAIASGSLVHCGISPDHPKQSWAHAGFSTCAAGQPKGAEDPASGDPVLVSGLQASGGPAWITCAEGCCTTDAS